MRSLLAFVLTIYLSACETHGSTLIADESILRNPPTSGDLEAWRSFKVKYNKSYSSSREENYRLGVFLEALLDIFKFNQQSGNTYKLGLNAFSDMSFSEFSSQMMGHRDEQESASDMNSTSYFNEDFSFSALQSAPSSKDWRNERAVTPIKQQGNCGSCWAFATIGALESQMFMKTKKLEVLSEQQLVDCSTENSGCNGGLHSRAYDYIQKAGGVNSGQSYRYTGRKGSCRHDKQKNVAQVRGVVKLRRGDERELMQAVGTVGPVAVAMDANRKFQQYKKGIFDDSGCNSNQSNHEVIIVGYGSENGKDFWWVRNSWGTSWGEKGYAKLARGKNRCGIANNAAYPRV